MNNPIVYVDPKGMDDYYYLVKWVRENNVEVKKVIPFYTIYKDSPDTYSALHDPTGWNTSYEFGTNKEKFDKWASKTTAWDAHIPFPKMGGVGLIGNLITEGAIAVISDLQGLDEPNIESGFAWQEYMESQALFDMEDRFKFCNIVGGFENLENAESYLKELTDQHENGSFEIIDVGDGLYRVRAGDIFNYSDLFEAIDERNHIREVITEDAWTLLYDTYYE